MRADDSSFLEVALVADEHDGGVRVAVEARLLEPAREVVEGLAPRDVVHEQRARRVPIVRPRDALEGLLTRLRR